MSYEISSKLHAVAQDDSTGTQPEQTSKTKLTYIRNTRQGRFVRRANLPSASLFSAHALRLLCSAQQDAKKAAYKKKNAANARDATHLYSIQ